MAVRRSIGWVSIGTAALVASVTSCGDDYRKDLEDGFPNGVSAAIGPDGQGDAEGSFRGALSYYHVPGAAIECMVDEAFADVSAAELAAQEPPVGLSWSPEQLDEYARRCDVDFSALWYSTD